MRVFACSDLHVDFPENRALLASVIRSLAASRAVVVATHDARLVSHADRVHHLEGGRLQEISPASPAPIEVPCAADRRGDYAASRNHMS